MIQEKNIAKIASTVLLIPSYQRGYRWKTEHVTALLDDLYEFAKSNEELYCLQPVVLKTMLQDGQRPAGERVVDGQQRLATIVLILTVLGVNPQWKFYNEEAEKYIDFTSVEQRDINSVFRANTLETIKNWLDKAEDRGQVLRRLLAEPGDKQQVIFIEYHIGDKESEQDVFNRLNNSKIPLTSAELIRALFMLEPGLSDNDKTEIAKEWEMMEATLRNERYWSMFFTGRQFVSVRMDLLFSMVADIFLDKVKVEPLVIYYIVEKRIKDAKDKAEELKKIWQEVLERFWWMQACYNKPETYNFLGWLALFSEYQVKKIYQEGWQKRSAKKPMESFQKYLKELIRNKGGYAEKSLSRFSYGNTESGDLQKLFVLLNLLYCNRQKEAFRFDLYKAHSWDIEHIDSQTENKLEDPATRKQWLDLAQQEMAGNNALLDEFGKCTSFAEQQAFIHKHFDDPQVEKDSIGNLALLDTHTNRAYGNAIFPAKRRFILAEMQSGNYFVPACTLQAFMKFYTLDAVQITRWSKVDSEAYAAAMNNLYKKFLEEECQA